MNLVTFFTTTIGKKIVVAITGLFMILFIVTHLLGNLQIFMGPNAVNSYAAWLKTVPMLVWSFRIALIVSVIAHIAVTISLTKDNMRARPMPYQQKKSRKASVMSRTMLLSGLTVLAFVIYHLAHYTLGITHPEYLTLTDNQGRHHVYNMMVMGFSNPLIAGFYILAQVLLASHLSHGISSATRTLGVSNAHLYGALQKIGLIGAVIIALLYITIPLSVLCGFVGLDY